MNRRRFARPRRGVRALVVCLAAVGAAMLLPGAAKANTYDVSVCDNSPTGTQNNSWSTYSSSGELITGQGCPAQHIQTNFSTGLFVRNHQAPTWIPSNVTAGWQMKAPAGNSLNSITATYWTSRSNGSGVFAGMLDDVTLLAGCWQGANVCADQGNNKWFSLHNSSEVRVEAGCLNPAPGCNNNNANQGYFLLYGATVTVNDLTTPGVSPSGPLWTGEWQHGVRGIGVTGSDAADGIQENEVRIDGHTYTSQQHGCDYTRATPCGHSYGDYWLFDTAQLGDGPHTIEAITWDAARLAGVAPGTIYVDNSSPSEPSSVSVDGGEGWRSSNDFSVAWSNPTQGAASPIAAAHYSLCRAGDPTNCPVADRRVAGDGLASLSHINVPDSDDFVLRVWLEDKAGNTDSTHLSDPVHLRFDPTVPGLAQPTRRNHWINAVEAKSIPQEVRLADRAAVGKSGIGGYAVTWDGSMPGATINASGPVATIAINDLTEGRHAIRARAVSGAGVPAADSDVGTTEIDIDKTAPSISLDGAPDPSSWHRDSVSVRLTASDQASLSGMQGINPADGNARPTDWAYIEYRLDGQGPIDRPGPNIPGVSAASITVPVDTDGAHTLAYKGVDLAGNESGEKSVQVKIDGTAPELVAFEAQDMEHPNTVSVAVSDKTSGIASGLIQMRAEGSAEWTDLATSLAGDHLISRVDDSSLTPGPYEFQARVRDVAGNETISNRRRDGRVEILTAPFRSNARMAAGIVKSGVKGKPRRVSAKCRRSRKCMTKVRTQRKRAAGKQEAPSGTVSSLTVPYGKSAVVKGSLASNDNQPLAGQPVDVYQQLDSTGQRFVRVATVRTNGSGQFDYHAPKGPSRALRFQFDGTETVHPASAQVKLLVTASSTLRANRHYVLNGQSVRFAGRVGRPVVDGLKIIDLQAFYRGKWRTFATPRTTARGAWKYTYRFEATSGVVNYRFRVRVRREASYPYQLGYSKAMTVTVRGR